MGDTTIGRAYVDKVCGRVRYAADEIAATDLRIHVLRSPLAHARLRDVRVDSALRPKVVRVLTARDIPRRILTGPLAADQPVLADYKIRFFGEPVALLVTDETVSAAEVQAGHHLDLEELPPVLSPAEALDPAAPWLHEKGNLLLARRIAHGDVEESLRTAAIVVEGTYRTGWLEHGYLETEAGWAAADGDSVLIRYPTQCPHFARATVAEMLGIDEACVRLVPTPVGGGFGGKLEVIPICLLALAAYTCQRRVALTYSRQESMAYTTKSHPAGIHYRTGATRDGRLVAAKVDFVLDTGAYASYGPGVLTRMAVHALGPYSVPHYEINGKLVYTNNPVAGAMRGFGVAQMAFAYESQIELVAKEAGLDPFEIRLRNVLHKGDRTATRQELGFEVGLETCIRKARQLLEAQPAVRLPRQDHMARGVGVAAFLYGIGNTGHPNPAVARIEALPDNSVRVFTSSADMGQHPRKMLAEIASRELGIPVECVEVVPTDTSYSPDSGITSASRTVFYVGNAVKSAAGKLRHILEENVPVESPGSSQWPIGAEAVFAPPVTSLDPLTGSGDPYATYSFGCHAVEVLVDTETYEVRTGRYAAVHDSGSIIDMRSARGQVEGGIAMGIGMALSEECVVTGGKVANADLARYLLPGCQDIPLHSSVAFVETQDPLGPLGAKGLAEPALVPAAAAIANAVADATGVVQSELPMTPERLWRACARSQGTPSGG